MFETLAGKFVKVPGMSNPVFAMSSFATVATSIWVGVHLVDDGIRIYRWSKFKIQARRAAKERAVEEAARAGAKQGAHEGVHQHA